MTDTTPIEQDDPHFKPWLTYGILVVLVIIYGCELRFAVNDNVHMAPSIQTLVALGGLNRTVVLSMHEWYRFFTGPLLHANFLHLLFNGIALFFCGIVLEKIVGRRWYFAFFALGTLGGSLMSFIANPPDTTSVGASGAIMALFAALFATSFHLPHGPRRKRIQVESIRILIPSLLPLASPGEHIDIAAHLGGAITGGALAFFLLRLWASQAARPPYQILASGVTVIGLVAFWFSISLAAFNYHVYTNTLAMLMPDSEIPKTNQDIKDKSSELLRRYPHDPRAHIFRARDFLLSHDIINARFELETGLKDCEAFRFIYGQRLSNTIRIMLAAIWIDNGAKVEAQKIMQAPCHATGVDRPDSKVYDIVSKYNLCN